MRIDGEMEENEKGDEVLVALSIRGSRAELELFGRFLLGCAEELDSPRVGPGTLKVSQRYLDQFSPHFEGFPVSVSVALESDQE